MEIFPNYVRYVSVIINCQALKLYHIQIHQCFCFLEKVKERTNEVKRTKNTILHIHSTFTNIGGFFQTFQNIVISF